MEPQNHKLVPKHTEGVQKDLKEHVFGEDIEDAEEIFIIAKDRLINVNNWKKICSSFSAEFALTDSHGHEVHRNAHYNDYICINIPGPGTKAGQGYDWVHIEALEYDDYPDEDYETFAMRVRPSINPKQKTEDTAHFFSDAATSTFVIERRGVLITVHYHGRNEVANTDNSTLDTIRNVAVSTGARLFASETQWHGLIKGLIDGLND